MNWIHLLLLLFRANSGLLKEVEIIYEGSWTEWSNKALHQILHLMLSREGSPLSKKAYYQILMKGCISSQVVCHGQGGQIKRYIKFCTNIWWHHTSDIVQGGITVVDIYSEWSGPCTAMQTALKKIKLEVNSDVDVVFDDNCIAKNRSPCRLRSKRLN